jgi:glycine/D-amino acid oxidase-like deaminating enzyme
MVKTEVIIVGQGLAGTWLSWALLQAGIDFVVVDQPNKNGASVRAAGLINPVTGRRLVKTWMIEDLMPFAASSYTAIGHFLNEPVISETAIIDFFPSVQMLQSFQKRFKEDPEYLKLGNDRGKYDKWFDYPLGWGAIQPCFLVQVEKLLTQWRTWLKSKSLLNEYKFEISELKLHTEGVTYLDIAARYIIFCDGVATAQNPYFEKLPFALNKGEGLLVEIYGLPTGLVFKKGMNLVPYAENMYWLGASYEWSYSDDQPSEKFRENAENWLHHFLKVPFTTMEHFAAIRPATLERRPFVGFHPANPQMGILNGLGTKGCTLAPYFARQLADLIREEVPVDSQVDIRRFTRVMGRS